MDISYEAGRSQELEDLNNKLSFAEENDDIESIRHYQRLIIGWIARGKSKKIEWLWPFNEQAKSTVNH